MRRRSRNIDDARKEKRLAVIKSFQLREFVAMLIDQLGDFPDNAGAVCGQHLRPRTFFKSLARGLHGAVNVGFIASGNLREDFSGRWIVGIECLTGQSFHPLSTNEHLLRLLQKRAHVAMNLDWCSNGSHDFYPLNDAGNGGRKATVFLIILRKVSPWPVGTSR